MANQQASISFPFYTLEASGPASANARLDVYTFVENAGTLSPDDVAEGIRSYLEGLPQFTAVVISKYESVQTVI